MMKVMNFGDGGSTAGLTTASHDRVAERAPREALPPLPALTILCHPDLGRVGDRVLLTELVRGREAFVSRQVPFFAPPCQDRGRPLEDRFVSRRPIRIAPLPDDAVRIHRDGSRTAVLMDGVPLDEVETLSAARLDAGVVFELARRVVLLFHRLPRPSDPTPPHFGMVGESEGIVQVRRTIERVAGLDIPVLLRGETGTGKELAARALHAHSRRRQRRFVGVNLGTLTPSLAAAELFGTTKGAYTGADREQPGYFQVAQGGTLFLDEIGEAPPELQVMLLRTLEDKEVMPVGCQTPKRVNVRIVSATDADLERMAEEGRFKAPLLHRLMSYKLVLPPLRTRRDDIGRLLVHFLGQEWRQISDGPLPGASESRAPWLPASVVSRLARYGWPGNVRQLRNVARQLLIDSYGQETLDVGSRLDALLTAASELTEPPPHQEADQDDTLALNDHKSAEPYAPPWRKPSDVTEKELMATLRDNRFELKATARALGVSRTSLYTLVQRSPNVRSASDVPPEDIREAYDRLDQDVAAMSVDLEVSERALRQRLKDLGLR